MPSSHFFGRWVCRKRSMGGESLRRKGVVKVVRTETATMMG